MKKFSAFLLLYIGISSPLFAAEPLTWDACLKIAADNNPDLLSAERALESKRAQYRGSYNELMPRLTVSNSYTDSKTPNPDSRWSAAGTASMDIFNTSRYADIRTFSANRDQAEASLKLASSALLFNLRSAFAGLLFAQNEVLVSKNIKDLRQRDADLVTLSYKSGRESKGNMLRSKAQLLEAQLDLAQSERDLKAAQQELNHQLGKEEFDTVTATGTLAAKEPIQEPSDWNALVNSNPSVLLEQSNLAVARAGLSQSRSALWPSLTANYTKSFTGASEFPDQPDWVASGVLSLPVFGGGPTAAYYGISGAKRNLEKAQEDLRSARTQVRSDLEGAWSALAGAVDQVTIQTAFLESARQRNGEADIRYSSGLLAFENWELIVTDRVNFERSLIRAERDAVIAQAQWEKSLGKGLGD